MLNNKFTQKVVVVSPSSYTGGPEALHQLDLTLRELGVDSYIYYIGDRNENGISDFQRRFNCREYKDMADTSPLLVLPEIQDPEIWRKKGWLRIVIWWLAAARLHELGKYDNCFHIFQSRYAQVERSFDGFIGPIVSDYIRSDFVDQARAGYVNSKRKNKILFNHRTAAWLARAKMQGLVIDCELLVGLSSDEMINKMSECKYFLDAGWHPGRDRMMREAALCGAIVIVGNQGAAAYKEDVPLPSELRIDDSNWSTLRDCMRSCERNASKVAEIMQEYSFWVKNQKSNFEGEVRAFISDSCGPWGCETGAKIKNVGDDRMVYMMRMLNSSRDLQAQVGLACFKMVNRMRIQWFFYMLCIRIKKFFKLNLSK